MATVHRFIGSPDLYKWEGVESEKYGDDEIVGVVKHILIGQDEGAPSFVIRYFRVEKGGHSQLERHSHEHGVVILHGKAKVQLNGEYQELEPYDVVYVGGNDLHQFSNIGEDALGFLCVIPPID